MKRFLLRHKEAISHWQLGLVLVACLLTVTYNHAQKASAQAANTPGTFAWYQEVGGFNGLPGLIPLSEGQAVKAAANGNVTLWVAMTDPDRLRDCRLMPPQSQPWVVRVTNGATRMWLRYGCAVPKGSQVWNAAITDAQGGVSNAAITLNVVL